MRVFLVLLLSLGIVGVGVLSSCDEEKKESGIKVNERPVEGEGGEAEGDDEDEAAEEGGGDESMDFSDDDDEGTGGKKGATVRAGTAAANKKRTVTAAAPGKASPATRGGSDESDDTDDAAGSRKGGAGKKRTTVSRSFLRVTHMLDRKDVREALDFKDLLEEGEFVGQPASATYNATRLATEGGGFGVALQVWKLKNGAAATRQYDDLYKRSLGGERSRDAGDSSFRTVNHGLHSVVFVDKRRSTVAWVTCEANICSFEELSDLARRIQRRL